MKKKKLYIENCIRYKRILFEDNKAIRQEGKKSRCLKAKLSEIRMDIKALWPYGLNALMPKKIRNHQ